MKKFNVLSMSLLLGTVPLVTYADYIPVADDGPAMSESMDGMETESSDDELAFAADWKGPWEDLFYLPSNITVDNSNPRNMRLCSPHGQKMDYQEDGNNRTMAEFTVKATVSIAGVPDPTPYSIATFKQFKYSPFPAIAGAAPPGNDVSIVGLPNFTKTTTDKTAHGGGMAQTYQDIDSDGEFDPNVDKLVWRLVQQDSQTWSLPWSIQLGDGVTLHSIEIDLLSKKGWGPKGGFDILLRPNDDPKWNVDKKGTVDTSDDVTPIHSSPGSGAGWPVQPKQPIKNKLSNVDYTATYSKPIVLMDNGEHPNGWLAPEGKHDLYGKVTIDFPNGITANSTKFMKGGTLFEMGFIFWADTDCLPATSAEAILIDEKDIDGNDQVMVRVEMGNSSGDTVIITDSSGNIVQNLVFDHLDDDLERGPFPVTSGVCYFAWSTYSPSDEEPIGWYCHEK